MLSWLFRPCFLHLWVAIDCPPSHVIQPALVLYLALEFKRLSEPTLVPMHHATPEPVDLQGDIVLEDIWSLCLYEEVMQAAQARSSD
jgi:hypothetical protein